MFTKGPSIKIYATEGEGTPSKMRTAAYKGKGVSRLMCTYALTSLFMLLALCLSYGEF